MLFIPKDSHYFLLPILYTVLFVNILEVTRSYIWVSRMDYNCEDC